MVSSYVLSSYGVSSAEAARKVSMHSVASKAACWSTAWSCWLGASSEATKWTLGVLLYGRRDGWKGLLGRPGAGGGGREGFRA